MDLSVGRTVDQWFLGMDQVFGSMFPLVQVEGVSWLFIMSMKESLWVRNWHECLIIAKNPRAHRDKVHHHLLSLALVLQEASWGKSTGILIHRIVLYLWLLQTFPWITGNAELLSGWREWVSYMSDWHISGNACPTEAAVVIDHLQLNHSWVVNVVTFMTQCYLFYFTLETDKATKPVLMSLGMLRALYWNAIP